MAVGGQEGDRPHQIQEQDGRDCQREAQSAVRDDPEGAVPQPGQGFPQEQLRQLSETFGREEALERHLQGPAAVRVQRMALLSGN